MTGTGFAGLPAVAREAIRARFDGREPAAAAGEPLARAPVFVTLKIDGVLRGCMGSLVPSGPDLAAEARNSALLAAFRDPRFPALKRTELPRCSIEVTVLDPLEPATEADLDPARYGIEIADSTGRRGILLPAIDGVDSPADQVEVCRNKAGIPDGAPFTLRRFTVQKTSD